MGTRDEAAQTDTRWPAEWIARRKELEAERAERHSPARKGKQPRLPFPYRILRLLLKTTRLYERGYQNYLDIRLREIDHYIDNWPPASDSVTLLQVSDLHLDLDSRLLPELLHKLDGLRCDLAVFTGDFVEFPETDYNEAFEGMRRILETLGRPPLGTFGVLGNHDSLAFARRLEVLGLPILVNEARICETAAGPFALAGVDDAYVFTADVEAAAGACPAGMPALLLSHSPQVALRARDAGFSVMLSGHTHGGQVCLPGGHSLVHMDDIPPPLFKGRWRLGPLHGYTTTGTGSSHLPVRFNCPPEIVLHRLRSARS